MIYGAMNVNQLVLARQFRQLSQTGLAKDARITQAALSKIESGELTPSPETEKNIIKALNFPKSFFEVHCNDAISTLSFHAYRKSASVPVSQIQRIHAELHIKHSHYSKISPYLPKQNLPSSLFEIKEPSLLAKELRAYWGVGDNPIENITMLIEQSGIPVYLCDFGSASIYGVTTKDSESVKAIFLNKNQPADRYRFSLAHELFHYIAHADEIECTDEMEDEANLFAAELLLPASQLYEPLRNLKLETLVRLKQEWRVSMAALIYRAKSIGSINAVQSTSLWKLMAMKGFRKIEPFPLKPERPYGINNAIHSFLKEKEQPLNKACTVFDLSEDDFRLLYPNFYDSQEVTVT